MEKDNIRLKPCTHKLIFNQAILLVPISSPDSPLTQAPNSLLTPNPPIANPPPG